MPASAAAVDAWFADRGWEPMPFQREAWGAFAAGKSGLLHAPTGLGKTLAAWLGPVMEAWEGPDALRVLWLTPLRALAADTVRSLQEPLAGLGRKWTVAARTGDTAQSQRAKLRKHGFPFCLVTTPESLSLMLTHEDARERFAGLSCVVCDEWHELLSSKRGVQTELCLARLRQFAPRVRTWGLSATIGNLDQALEVLLGPGARDAAIIHSRAEKPVVIETLLPPTMEHFPWSGHLGTRMLGEVVKRIEATTTTLLFTNTRSQTEIWFQELLDAKPEWEPVLAMHHGSLEREVREAVEQRLRDGTVKCVVCTSSLDLGVDFSPVEQVMQLGSPKGIARLLQRAGRSGHRPGAVSRVVGVPTNAFELVEFAATRAALVAGRIEARRPLRLPLDVLLQHLLTVAVGEGFRADEMLAEVRSTHAYAGLCEREWEWLLTFITTGGALRAYPEYHKAVIDETGRYRVVDPRVARLHRMSIGTIVSDTAVSLRLANGRRLGTVEEWFISRLKPGQMFIFGGRRLELVRHQGLTATVKPATRKNARGQIPSWQGGKSPLSTELADAVALKLLEFQNQGNAADPEMRCVTPILRLQQQWSVLPAPDELLIEHTRTRDGHHVYLYPFAGRVVNEGVGMLVAYRMARGEARSIQVTPNDYGCELHSVTPMDFDAEEWRALLSPEHLLDDLFGCLNTAELGRHQFREVARVAGLVLQGFPGSPKTARALQVSSGLLYDVFAKYDPENRLLAQATREVLERQLEIKRLQDTLEGLQSKRLILQPCERLSPMAFPLWADGISSHLSTEDFASRLERMLAALEDAAARQA
jgi:ATP-dependent helicase Lhr and Lhr-like helicase